jgi:hypothetical protein
LREGQNSIVVVRNMETQLTHGGEFGGKAESQVHNTVGDGLSCYIHAVGGEGIESLGEGEFNPLAEEGVRDGTSTTSRVLNENLIDRRRLTAVHKVPKLRRALIETGINFTCIGHGDILRGVPLERVLDGTRSIAIVGNPNLDILALPRTEAREGHRLVGCGGDRDDNLLLGEFNRVRESMRSHIHTTGKSITLVLQNNLLNLELTEGES